MAVTKNEIQVKWAAADSKSVSSGGFEISDSFSFTAGAFKADIQIKADNDGTPAAGDVAVFKLLYTLGDPDGGGGDEFDDAEVTSPIGTIDTDLKDPARKTLLGIGTPKGGKIRVDNDAASNAITVSAIILEYILS